MTMPYRLITERGPSPQTILEDTFSKVHAHLNYWNLESEIARFNQKKSTKPFPISQTLHTFLKRINRYLPLTEGRFDPTIAPLQKTWQKALKQAKTPSEKEIKQAKKNVGWHLLHINRTHITKKKKGASLDLGGCAKGYTIDLIIEKLKENGYTNALMEWGGEIRTIGKHPSGRKWRIGIAHTTHPSIKLKDAAIATSGNTYQSWNVKVDGENKNYTHLIDPKTAKPIELETTFSVTVQAPNCLLADILASTALVMGRDHAENYLKRTQKAIPSIRFWLSR